MTPLVWLVAALATYRLTMLIVADEITAPWRDRIIERYVHPVHELASRPLAGQPMWKAGYPYSAECRCGMRWSGNDWSDVMTDANEHVNAHRGEQTTGPKWLMLLDCPWCASWWVAVPVAWSGWCFGGRAWWMIPAAALGFSAVTGIIASYSKPG